MAKYKAYPEYKDSGVEWLGKIPEYWNILTGKRIFQSVRTPALNNDEQLAASQKYGVIPQSLMMQLNDSKVMLALKGTDSFRHVDENNFVISLRSFEGGIEHSKYSGCVSPAYTVLKNTKPISYNYYRYLLKCAPFIVALQSSTDSLRDGKSINYEQFGALNLPLTSISEQSHIASFLDYETAKIDNLMEKQQQLIELLKEKRQAVISHAVTKGLDPDVQMKDSGVEWLGDVPEHWGVTKLKWVGRTTSGGTPTTSKFEIYYEDGHIPWIRTTDLNNGELFDTPIRITSKAVNDTACSILPVGSVLLGMYGGAGSIGKHAILRFESTINQAVCGVLPCGRVFPDFLHKYYEFYRPFWMIDAAGTRKDPNIGQDNIKEGIILIPPFEEQVEINNHIDNMRNIYECIIENALEGVDLLQERRTALISAAVTGKIDVRDWVAPETQDIEEPQEATA
ncbi:restriction endonuclease subunit S [Pantoea brenneri]|uniref:restriction endonuclease subunit S n=1 Tax=Pantoea brenneri TaxID=472694 RepID=UPI00244808B0|nr:restriction endonuclease subunit S [Pantoea brenneri]MDH1087618.1 restriction endonuclease subunit S [Pantoea brenneri]